MHFLNLTNGLACAEHAPEHRLMRLQSTWCEQRRWDDILWTTPPDFYVALAIGTEIVVHDISERDRVTRACWQGLEWIRVACAWQWPVGEVTLPRPGLRGGPSMRSYFAERAQSLDDRTVKLLRYYERFIEHPTFEISVCDGAITCDL